MNDVSNPKRATRKIILFSNTAWYLYNFRLPLAHALKEQGWKVVLVAPYDTYADHLEDAGFEFIHLNMQRRSINIIREFLLLSDLSAIFKSQRPDAILNFTIKCVIYGSLVAKLVGIRRRINAVAGLGSVFSAQTMTLSLLRPFVKQLLGASLSGGQSRCIVQNPDDADVFLSNDIIDSRQLVLIKGSGVDGEKFSPNLSKKSDLKRRKILFASRLLKSKGIYFYLDAAAALGEHYDFLVAGEPDPGNPESIQPQELTALSSQSGVVLLGHVLDMHNLLGDIDLVVLPSEYGEGVPRILIEAAASGIPLIAFDMPGCREIVRHGENGYLVPKGSQHDLNLAIKRVFSSDSHYQVLAENSRKHFVSQFEQSDVIQKTLNVIDSTEVPYATEPGFIH